MKNFLILLIVCIAFLIFGCTEKPPIEGNATCKSQQDLSVLNVNVLFTETINRNIYLGRLKDIATFIQNEDVDIILLQEMVGGKFAGTENTAQDLRDILSTMGMEFNLTTAWEIGESKLWSSANAILSKCKIIASDVKHITSPMTIGTKLLSVSRNVHLARIDIPNYGKVDIFNTHLCAACSKEERAKQVERVLEWVAEKSLNSEVVVLGGDFNFDLWDNNDSESGNYYKIIWSGFIDSYFRGQDESLDALCEDEDNPDEHCTIDVTKLGNASNPRRIDYIFSQGVFPIFVKIVFNELVDPQQPTVSDHAGVFVRFQLEEE